MGLNLGPDTGYAAWGFSSFLLVLSWSRDNVVGIVASEESWLDVQQDQEIFLFFKASRRALGPTQPTIQ
jgi:hypothetical protein